MSFPKIYTVNGPSSTSAASLPSWITIKQKPTRNASGQRKRVKTQHQLGSLELIQDFAFPGSSMRVKTTEDGEHVMATGTYKPMIKVWELDQLSVKFERVTESENVDFVMLSTDWTKSLHLQRDRSLQLHTQGGLHHTIRLPTYGRSLGYHSPSADAIVGCTGTEVFRFNLEEGRYMTPLEIARGWGDGRESEVEGVNVVDVNRRHGLWSFGLDGGGGVVEFWDPRSRTSLTRLCLPTDALLPATTLDQDSHIAPPIRKLSITSLASHPTDGLSLAVGTSSGHTLLYDLRSPSPFAVKDQGYGEPVIKVDWLRGGGAQEDNGRVISADSKVIKVWGKDDPTTNHLSLHPPNPLTDLHAVPESGLILAACEAPEMCAYYVPEIGPAPKWAGFLDNVTEEMADDTSAAAKGAYSDYKFVDKQELEALGLTHLVGTPALKPYMHGYFLSLKLYSTARLMANPNSYDEHREKLINARMEAKAESRIRARKDQPKVNKALAERLRRVEEGGGKKGKSKDKEVEQGGEGAAAKGGVLSDPRFKELFENPEFEVDEQSREFALLNPATVHNANLKAGKKTAVQEEEDDSAGSSSGLGSDDDDDDDEEAEDEDVDGGVQDAGSDDEMDGESGSGGASGSDSDSDDGDLRQYDPRKLKPGEEKRQMLRHYQYNKPQLQVASGSTTGNGRSSSSTTFGQRLHTSKPSRSTAQSDPRLDNVLAMRRSGDGGMEMSFIPSGSSKPKPSGGGGGGEDGGLFNDDFDKEQSAVDARKREKKVERFGHGLQKGLEEGEGEGDLEGETKSGRTKRRHPGRSASKNTFRKR